MMYVPSQKHDFNVFSKLATFSASRSDHRGKMLVLLLPGKRREEFCKQAALAEHDKRTRGKIKWWNGGNA